MTLQQIEYLLAVYSERNLLIAAEKLHVDPKSLRVSLFRTEKEIGVSLFNKDGRNNYTATEMGRSIMNEYREAMNHIRKAEQLFKAPVSDFQGTLRLGLDLSVSPYLLPKLIPAFKKNFPQVELFTQESSPDSITQSIRENALDIGILMSGHKKKNELEIPLYREPLVAYLSKNCEEEDGYDQDNIISPSLWTLQEAQSNEKNCACTQVSTHIVYSGNFDTLIRMVDGMNVGYTRIPFMQRAFLNPEQLKRTREISQERYNHRDISLLISKDYRDETMLNVLIQVLREIIPNWMWQGCLKKGNVMI